MPSPTSFKSKVLVSGASGFIAAWIVRNILERGGFVRGTVRSTAKGEYLLRLFEEHAGRFEYIIVDDVGVEGAFDNAVQQMDYVVHTASPFYWSDDDSRELIRPAVNGTIGILESVLKFGPTVKRVVITSSEVAITQSPPLYDPPRTTVFTEKDWNFESTEIVEKEGSDASQKHKYKASKVLAERAAWEFVDKHKEEIGWDLVALHPPFTFGPMIHEVSSPSSLNTSSATLLAILTNTPPLSATDLAKPLFYNFGDVRDVAWAHAEALINDQVGCKDKDAAFNEGKGRVALSVGPFTWQDVVDAINDSSTALPKATVLGERGAGNNAMHPVSVDSARARDVLGLKFRTTQETFVDTLRDFRAKAWVS